LDRQPPGFFTDQDVGKAEAARRRDRKRQLAIAIAQLVVANCGERRDAVGWLEHE
jgi:hypothetical protein